jgi:transposase
VHPLQCKAIASARLKNDKVDAAILAQLLRADLLPEAWIAPPEVRQLRAMVRHRIQLVRLRTLLRNRIHAILADHGTGVPPRSATRPRWPRSSSRSPGWQTRRWLILGSEAYAYTMAAARARAEADAAWHYLTISTDRDDATAAHRDPLAAAGS